MGTRNRPAYNNNLMDIASNVRKEVLKTANNPIFAGPESTGRCIDASVLLAETLKKAGINAKVLTGRFIKDYELPPELRGVIPEVEIPKDFQDAGFSPDAFKSEFHAWVEVDGKVVDITADQFNPFLEKPLPDIYVGPRTDRYIVSSSTTTNPMASYFDALKQVATFLKKDMPTEPDENFHKMNEYVDFATLFKDPWFKWFAGQERFQGEDLSPLEGTTVYFNSLDGRVERAAYHDKSDTVLINPDYIKGFQKQGTEGRGEVMETLLHEMVHRADHVMHDLFPEPNLSKVMLSAQTGPTGPFDVSYWYSQKELNAYTADARLCIEKGMTPDEWVQMKCQWMHSHAEEKGYDIQEWDMRVFEWAQRVAKMAVA